MARRRNNAAKKLREAGDTIREPVAELRMERDSQEHSERADRMIGQSAVMRDVFNQIRQAATAEIPILLMGETGTGKDIAARTIHRMSRRRGPYVPINIGAYPQDLVASELFGHERGAFTGATGRRVGVFENATGGTVFLDEIDAIDERARISLLRVVERKEFMRLGGKKPIKSDARLITATNADLDELVDEGIFRKDLFYRLDVFRITIPPLRERPEDIDLLAETFSAGYAREVAKQIRGISAECLDILRAYPWPGNIRELKNVMHQSVLLCNGDEIKPEHLPPHIVSVDPTDVVISLKLGMPFSEMERRIYEEAIKATDNSLSRAAGLLGVSVSELREKLKESGPAVSKMDMSSVEHQAVDETATATDAR